MPPFSHTAGEVGTGSRKDDHPAFLWSWAQALWWHCCELVAGHRILPFFLYFAFFCFTFFFFLLFLLFFPLFLLFSPPILFFSYFFSFFSFFFLLFSYLLILTSPFLPLFPSFSPLLFFLLFFFPFLFNFLFFPPFFSFPFFQLPHGRLTTACTTSHTCCSVQFVPHSKHSAGRVTLPWPWLWAAASASSPRAEAERPPSPCALQPALLCYTLQTPNRWQVLRGSRKVFR